MEKTMDTTTLSDLVNPSNAGFKEKVTAKDIDDSKLFLMKCTCGKEHFRHAGYMRVMMPYIESGGEKKMTNEPYQVMVCVACKRSTIWVNGQLYDVTDRIDLNAWEKLEVEAHKATGPGGEC